MKKVKGTMALVLIVILVGAIALLFASCPSGNGGPPFVPEYAVGDTGPGGGKIFYVSTGGFTVQGYGNPGQTGYFAAYTAHYLEAAPSNSGTSVQWGDNVTSIDGVTTFTSSLYEDATKIGNGRKDTQTIVAHLAAMSTPETGRAAQVASAETSGSQNDWFLPSLGELYLYYQSEGTGKPDTGYFWSSSQNISSNAWVIKFDDGLWGGSLKSNSNNVRAIRAF